MNTIYGIRAVGDEAVIYIGYTANFRQRKINHKFNILNPNSKCYYLPIYNHIREKGGYDKYEFVVLEQSKDNIKFKEREYTDKYGLSNLLNMRGGDTGLSKENYHKNRYEKNKEKINEKQKEYREKNREKLKEKFNCDICGGKFTRSGKSGHLKTNKHLSYINNSKTA